MWFSFKKIRFRNQIQWDLYKSDSIIFLKRTSVVSRFCIFCEKSAKCVVCLFCCKAIDGMSCDVSKRANDPWWKPGGNCLKCHERAHHISHVPNYHSFWVNLFPSKLLQVLFFLSNGSSAFWWSLSAQTSIRCAVIAMWRSHWLTHWSLGDLNEIWIINFWSNFIDWWQRCLLWNYPQMNITRLTDDSQHWFR